MQKDYANSYLGQSYMQAFQLVEPALVNTSQEKSTLLKTLDQFSFSDFVEQNKYWLKSGSLVTFSNGNISKEDALNYSQKAKKGLNLETVGLEHIA